MYEDDKITFYYQSGIKSLFATALILAVIVVVPLFVKKEISEKPLNEYY